MRYALLMLIAWPALAVQSISLTSLSPNSPNSVTAAYSSSGNLSYRVACGTDGATFATLTPWVPITSGTVTGSIFAAQLQPSTAYQCRMDGASLASGGGTLVHSTASSATTNPPLATTPLRLLLSTTTTGYNQAEYPPNSSDGDTPYTAWLQNGTILFQQNDGKGPQGSLGVAPYSSGRNTFLQTVDSAFTLISLLNPMGTGNGTDGVGCDACGNVPNCYSDGSTIKSANLFANGNTVLWPMYRQTVPGNDPFDSWVVRSDDAGATWYNPAHNSGQASANGDPACPGAGVMWPGTGNFAEPRWLQLGQGGTVSNPVAGIDAYRYVHFRNTPNTNEYLARYFYLLNPQDVTQYEYWQGSLNADANDPANWTAQGVTTGATIVWAIDNDVSGSDTQIQYLPDFGRFIATGEKFVGANDVRLIMMDAPSPTGPWVNRYTEPTQPPLYAPKNSHIERPWPTLFMPSYSFSGGAANVIIVTSGESSQRDADPAKNMYSPWLVQTQITNTFSTLVSGKATVSGSVVIQ